MVAFENILLELVGASLIGGSSFFVTQFFTISPFDKSWSKEKNTLAFCCVPLVVYAAFRIYFGLSFYLTSKIPSKYKTLEQISSFLLSTGGLAFVAYQPKIQSVFFEVYEAQVGSLPKVIYDLSKPNVESAYAFGLKILGLLCGWFVLLFCVELVLRVVVLFIGFIVRNTIYRNAAKKTDEIENAKNKSE